MSYFRGMKLNERDYVTRKEFSQLNNRVGNLESRQTRTETRTDHLEQKLDKIENNTTWILRIIISSIVVALLGLIINGGV